MELGMEGEELDDEVEERSYMAPVMRQRLDGRSLVTGSQV
jgi:hypothetical protein